MRAPAGSVLNPQCVCMGRGSIRHAWSLDLLTGEEPLLFGDNGQLRMQLVAANNVGERKKPKLLHPCQDFGEEGKRRAES